MRHVLLQQPLYPPTPRINKFTGNLLNIDSYVYHEDKKSISETTKSLDHIFDTHEWNTNEDYVSTLKNCRTKKMVFDEDEENDDDEHKFILLDDEKNNVSKQVVFKFQFKE